MSQTTIEVRQENPEEEENMARLEEPDNRVYGYLKRSIADQLGEYLELTISDDADVTANQDKTTTNFGVYETPGESVVGLGVNKDILDEFTGEEEEAPESVGLTFAASDEEAYEEVVSELEEEASEEEEALIAGDSDDEEESEEEVEISDEELDLVEQ